MTPERANCIIVRPFRLCCWCPCGTGRQGIAIQAVILPDGGLAAGGS